MKKIISSGILAALLASVLLLPAQDAPQMPQPTKEHAWLQKCVGEWETETPIHMEPGKPPVKAAGSEVVKEIGGFWILSQGKSDMMGQPFLFSLTLGYDPAAKAYTGTWVDSMSSHLWKYTGTVDAAGKTMTLESEGPCPMKPGQLSKFKDVTEFKSDVERTFTSSMLGDDGKWITLATGVSKKRKK